MDGNSEKKVQVPSAMFTEPWLLLAALVGVILASRLVDGIESLLLSIVAYVGLLIVFAFCYVLLFAFVFGGQVSFTDEGITQKTIFRQKFTSWSEIIQIGYTDDQNPRVIIILRKGGRKYRETDKDYPYLRNTGRIIVVPEEEGVLEIITRHYGPLDFDMTKAHRH